MERGSTRGRGREGSFIYFFLAFKTDGSLCAERKCLLTQLAHYWWLPANDNNGIGECEQQCSSLSSDALRTEGWQPADTVARPPRPGSASGGTHRASRQHPHHLAAASEGLQGFGGVQVAMSDIEVLSQVRDQIKTWGGIGPVELQILPGTKT